MFKNLTPVKIGVVAFLVAVIFVFAYVNIGSLTYSEGERSGVITKFSHKGMLLKTWEGELNMGGYDQGGVASVWQFSVDDSEVVEKIKKAQRAGGRWTLTYRQQFWSQSWKGQTEYFVTHVEPATGERE